MKPHPIWLLASVFMGCATAVPPPAPPPARQVQYIDLKILAFNDFHGHLEGPSGTVRVNGTKVAAGGAEYLSSRIKEIQKYHPHTLVVGAGDMVGASPLLSALFHDEPAIEALNAAGLEITAVGNHEFDEGVDELLRLSHGGCHPKDGCQDGDDFAGAKFKFLGANVVYSDSGKPVFPAYEIREFEGIKIGFIGLTLQGTGQILAPEARAGVKFLDEVETINNASAELQAQGIETIVVLIHEGGVQTSGQERNGCENLTGPILRIVDGINPAVDAVISGHTHKPYICEFNNTLVTSAKAYGLVLTEIDLRVSRQTGDVIRRRATNLVIDSKSPRDPVVRAIIEKYQDIVGPLAERPIGSITADISATKLESGESPMGALVADMQLAATADTDKGGAQMAFMNPGGIRDGLTFEPKANEGEGVVTFQEAHAVQPFANSLVTMTLTGAQIAGMLEQQWLKKRPGVLMVSQGLAYTWSRSAAPGTKIQGPVTLNGEPLTPEANYRVTVNSYLAGGGDGFDVLQEGTARVAGGLDIEAFDAYFAAHSPVPPPKKARILVVD